MKIMENFSLMVRKLLDYKKELESAARTMILIHDPETLIKLIVRRIVRKVGVRHAGILLYNSAKDTYILTVSRGEKGLKIPAGFARIDSDNPIIRFFKEHYDKKIFGDGVVDIQTLKRILKASKRDKKTRELLNKVAYQMDIFEAVALVPSFHRDNLLAILILGKKEDGRFFKKDELEFFSALAADVAMAIRNAQLFEDAKKSADKYRSLFEHTTIALAEFIDAKDPYTHGHTQRVVNYSEAIAGELKKEMKLEPNFMENLHIAALLHDVGKVIVEKKILNKQQELTIGEWNEIKRHPVIGAHIVSSIRELHDCVPGIKYHHEKYNGSGYPEGLKGDRIPLSAAIIAVADAFDAMTSERPYRRALSREEAIAEISRCAGKHFEPTVAKAAIMALAKL